MVKKNGKNKESTWGIYTELDTDTNILNDIVHHKKLINYENI